MMEKKKIDPWLLKALDASAAFPEKPYDLTKVKAITKWPDIGIWQDGMMARDWLEVQTGAFDILGEMPSLHTLLFPLGFRHQDYAFLTGCKKRKNWTWPIQTSGTVLCCPSCLGCGLSVCPARNSSFTPRYWTD